MLTTRETIRCWLNLPSIFAAAVIAGVYTYGPGFDEREIYRTVGHLTAMLDAKPPESTAHFLEGSHFEGTRILFKANGKTTANINAFDMAVWFNGKDQITVMPACGPWAGNAITFQPNLDNGTLRISRPANSKNIFAKEAKEQVYHLREFAAPGDLLGIKTSFVYKPDNANVKPFRISGAVVQGKPFEVSFGAQHKLAFNMATGSFVFNTYGYPTFYGRIPMVTADASSSLGLRPGF